MNKIKELNYAIDELDMQCYDLMTTFTMVDAAIREIACVDPSKLSFEEVYTSIKRTQ